MKNIEFLNDNNIKVTLKSTITPNDFKYMYDSYIDIKSIIKKYNLNCRYSPTIDIYNVYDIVDFGLLDYNINKIYEDEKSENRPYFSWGKRKICYSGIHYFGIDITGSVYQCHKCFYNKDSYIIGNIKEKDIFKNMIKFRKGKEEKLKNFININCKRCKSKHCILCSLLKNEKVILCNIHKNT